MFKMPKVKKAEMVAWHMNGVRTRDWTPALVVQVNHDNLELLIFGRNVVNVIPKDGVRHVDDPKAQALRDQTIAAGVWEPLEEAQARDEREQQKDEEARKPQKQLAAAK